MTEDLPAPVVEPGDFQMSPSHPGVDGLDVYAHEERGLLDRQPGLVLR